MATKPVFRRAGGKRRLIKHFEDWLPVRPQSFVEPFCGGAAVLLSREKPVGVLEVLNDLNQEITNVYRCIRHHGAEVVRCLDWMPNSLAEFKAQVKAAPDTDILRAVRWLYLNWLSFGSTGDSFGWSRGVGGGAAKRIDNKQADILALAARLQGVIIDCRDYAAVLKTFDAPGAFFFVDPPYLKGDCEYAAWGMPEFETLARQLRNLQGDWVLTTSGHQEMKDLFSSWCEVREITRQRGIDNKTAAKYAELVIRRKRKR